jgi:hypothetical protein
MYTISPELKELIESGVAIVVATGDSAGRPQMRYGWAARVRDDARSVDVYLDTQRSEQILANLDANGRIAMTVGDPVSYRSVQLKGRFLDRGEPTPDDMEWVQRGHEAFLISTSLVGDPPETIRNLWTEEVLRVTFAVEAAFDQTPGPEAGKPL